MIKHKPRSLFICLMLPHALTSHPNRVPADVSASLAPALHLLQCLKARSPATKRSSGHGCLEDYVTTLILTIKHNPLHMPRSSFTYFTLPHALTSHPNRMPADGSAPLALTCLVPPVLPHCALRSSTTPYVCHVHCSYVLRCSMRSQMPACRSRSHPLRGSCAMPRQPCLHALTAAHTSHTLCHATPPPHVHPGFTHLQMPAHRSCSHPLRHATPPHAHCSHASTHLPWLTCLAPRQATLLRAHRGSHTLRHATPRFYVLTAAHMPCATPRHHAHTLCSGTAPELSRFVGGEAMDEALRGCATLCEQRRARPRPSSSVVV